jgi:hypothetical protein
MTENPTNLQNVTRDEDCVFSIQTAAKSKNEQSQKSTATSTTASYDLPPG